MGVVWIISGAVMGLIVAFALRPRSPGALVVALLAGSGAAVAWGGLLLQADPTVAEQTVAIATLAVLFPIHARIVLGPFGRR
ncbi:MAG TPA: hypothetical protein VEA19_04835 [Actinomycetota bacterium]|nr:hypothetical protein [Actinomycetota bacterium]